MSKSQTLSIVISGLYVQLCYFFLVILPTFAYVNELYLNDHVQAFSKSHFIDILELSYYLNVLGQDDFNDKWTNKMSGCRPVLVYINPDAQGVDPEVKTLEDPNEDNIMVQSVLELQEFQK